MQHKKKRTLSYEQVIYFPIDSFISIFPHFFLHPCFFLYPFFGICSLILFFNFSFTFDSFSFNCTPTDFDFFLPSSWLLLYFDLFFVISFSFFMVSCRLNRLYAFMQLRMLPIMALYNFLHIISLSNVSLLNISPCSATHSARIIMQIIHYFLPLLLS